MCGIVGIAANRLNKIGKNIFSDLMIVSNVRGRWGAGVAAVVGDKIKGVKSLYSGCDLIDMKGFGELMNENSVRVLLGHTRWPTKGATGEYINVHPHFMKNLTGVHNGTLDKVDGAYIKGEDSDSVEFYKHADEVGFKKALSRASGAYCFVFVDHETKTLNFLRNNQRPLFIGKHLWGKDAQSLIWASEREMIVFAMSRANLMKDLEIIELPTNEMWSIPYDIKKGDDFEITKALFAGSDFWRPLGNHKVSSNEGGWPFRGGTFQKGSGVDRVLPPVKDKPTSNVGKQTFVFRNGQFVAKSSILNPPVEQVCLRRSESADESEGTTTVRLPDRKGIKERALDKQRSEAVAKVSLGNSGSTFLNNLVKGIEKQLSKDEQEFLADAACPDYEGDNQKLEEEFEKLLAQEVEGKGDVWSDLQDEDAAVKYVETLKGVWIPETEYLEILKFGCAWLGDPATPEDDLYWIEKDVFIFRCCLQDKECIADMSLMYPNDPYIKAISSSKTFKKNVAPQHVTMQ